MKKTPLDPRRKKLIEAIAALPVEAFGYVVAWASGVKLQFPDGLGGFSDESRASIDRLRAEAKAFMDTAK